MSSGHQFDTAGRVCSSGLQSGTSSGSAVVEPQLAAEHHTAAGSVPCPHLWGQENQKKKKIKQQQKKTQKPKPDNNCNEKERGINRRRSQWCTAHLLTTCWPCPACPGSDQLLPVYTLGMWDGISLWLPQVRSPGHDPSLLLHFLPGRAWETEKSLTQDKLCLTTIKTSASYQHYSHPEFKTQQCTKMKINPIPSENWTSS